MSESITLTLPLPPNLGNARMHWRTRNKVKTEYWLDCYALWLRREIPRARKCADRTGITAHCIVWAQNDVDNLFARMKFALDFLVSKGYIADDSPKHLEWLAIPTQEVSRKKPSQLILTLTPIGDK